MPRTRVPLVRPARFAMGGGAASAFGNSGAPGVPSPNSERGRALAVQYADDERGRFTERLFPFPDFAALQPGGSTVPAAVNTQSIEVVSNRTDFVRLVAFRGVITFSDRSPTAFDLANLKLQLSINSEEDLMT